MKLHPYILLLLLVIFSMKVAQGMILTKPQHFIIKQQKHLLVYAQIPLSHINEMIVFKILDGTINTSEAYRLKIAPDSVLIDTIEEKKVY